MHPWKFSLLLLAGSLALTAVVWLAGLPFFFFFLFIPLLPFFYRNCRVKRCPVCGWETAGSERFCPFDATPIRDPGSGDRERED